MITGDTLIEWGFTPGAWFKGAIAGANEMEKSGYLRAGIKEWVAQQEPKIMAGDLSPFWRKRKEQPVEAV